MITTRKKTMIAIFSTLFMVFVCCGGFCLSAVWPLSQAIITDPLQAKALGAEIAQYTLPTDYTEIGGMHFQGGKTVTIAGELVSPDEMVIILGTIPNQQGIDKATVQEQLQLLVQIQLSFLNLDLSVDRIETQTLNDQEVSFTYRTGQNGAGVSYQQMSGLLIINQEPVFILAQGSQDRWNQQALDTLLHSIQPPLNSEQ